MVVLSGDEFLCLQQYKKIAKSSPPLSTPKLIISRSAKDAIPEDKNSVFIMSQYTNKKADMVFEYIKPSEINLLKSHLGKYKDYYEFVPVSEFKDLKNSQYAVMAYDLMLFKNSVLPFIKHNDDQTPLAESGIGNVFEFVDRFMELDFEFIFNKYMYVFSETEESFFWVLENTANLCLDILSGHSSGVHPYRIQKYTPIAKKLGYLKLFAIKQCIINMINSTRCGEGTYGKIRAISELLLY